MSKVIHYFIITILPILLSSCFWERTSEHIETIFSSPPKEVETQLYKNGTPVDIRRVSSSHEKIRTLFNFIIEYQYDTEYSLVTFAPKCLVIGSEFTINIFKSFVVLQLDVGKESRRQVVIRKSFQEKPCGIGEKLELPKGARTTIKQQ